MQDFHGKEEVILRAGLLYREKLLNNYYRSYRGELSYMQAFTLDEIVRNNGLRFRDIQEKLDIPKQHSSKIVGHLQALDLIRIEPSETDRRVKILHATEKGKALSAAHVEQSFVYLAKITSCLTEREKELLWDAAMTLVSIFEKITPV